ncbi:receptor protein-tyrosine kinase CEPR2-like [Salvia divinorum]|uniref:non-specific serine/threonine protein kinase n=1 Tax=Salvia divinorum TaxID=28513 RepID=A0ABD1GFD7_SALDI
MTKPSNSTFSLQILTVFLISLSCFKLSQCLKSEVEALLEFRKHIIDPLNHLESWKDSNSDSDSPCRFYGIHCDQEMVTGISLDNLSLSGEISPSLSALRGLASLALTSHSLTGPLPAELSKCLSLKILNVSGNYLSGSVPDLSVLTSLEVLDLSLNSFTGPFPGWVGSLTSLVSLGLGENSYDEGEIPRSIGELKKLQWLYLANSSLRGEIPESIFELEALSTLDICINKITGRFPASIAKMRKLFKIELYSNNLTGEIPAGVANLTDLEEFDVSNNQMHGVIPKEIGSLKKLTVFQLFKNNFSGEIPSGFGEMQHLNAFSIYKNAFTGVFPQNLGRFSPLNSIDISENRFSGPFPKYLCQNKSLQNLLALGNDFSGAFPDSYGDCSPLQRLRVSQNRLNGSIADGVWALPNVQVMDFSDNSFTGRVAPDIGASLQLTELMLSNNRFSGELPRELGGLALMERIYLNNNNFSGGIPSQLGALKQIASLHLEGNALSGSIPAELANCPRLVDLNLASNHLSGGIPRSFSIMASLNSLDLSRNELTGSIPKDFDRLRFSYVDLSDNRLSGSVPRYFVMVAGDKALAGNDGLCLDEDEEEGKKRKFTDSALPVCVHQRNGHESLIKSKVAMSCIILVTLIVFLVGLLFVSYRNFKKGEADGRMGDEKDVLPWKLESFQQVEFDVDDIYDVDEDNLIGSGSTGKVYRLDLSKGCGTVAVKQLWRGNGVKLMAAEMEILGKIRHRNIVKLYACLMKAGSNFLVFEYMSNGNLFQALHREIKAGKPELDWHQRYKIAVGAAKGIAYLHHDCSPPIVHRDIKSTNILLDEDYEAKVADFGVARVADQSSPKGSEWSSFAGTHGYFAPEMAYSLKVTEKSDVYSFGVVLLELVTGRRPVEEEYGDGKDLVYWVSTHLNSREDVVKVLDAKAVPQLLQDDAVKVLKVATLCTSKLPNLRPSMKEVVKMLVDAEPGAGLRSPDSAGRSEKGVCLDLSGDGF